MRIAFLETGSHLPKDVLVKVMITQIPFEHEPSMQAFERGKPRTGEGLESGVGIDSARFPIRFYGFVNGGRRFRRSDSSTFPNTPVEIRLDTVLQPAVGEFVGLGEPNCRMKNPARRSE